MPSFWSLAR